MRTLCRLEEGAGLFAKHVRDQHSGEPPNSPVPHLNRIVVPPPGSRDTVFRARQFILQPNKACIAFSSG